MIVVRSRRSLVSHSRPPNVPYIHKRARSRSPRDSEGGRGEDATTAPSSPSCSLPRRGGVPRRLPPPPGGGARRRRRGLTRRWGERSSRRWRPPPPPGRVGGRTVLVVGIRPRQRPGRVRPASDDRGRMGGGAILGGEAARDGDGRDRRLAGAEQLEKVSAAFR